MATTIPVFIKLLQFKEVHGRLPDVYFFNPADKDLVTPIEGIEFRYNDFIERRTFIAGLKDSIDSFFDIDQLNPTH